MYTQQVGLSGVNARAIQYAETSFNGQGLQHTEQNTLIQSFNSQNLPVYMGLIKTLHDLKENPVPLIAETEFAGNVLEVDTLGQEIHYSREFSLGCPRAVEDVNDTTIARLGVRGEPFYLLLDRPDYVAFDVLSYDRWNGKDVYVTATPPKPQGDNTLYEVKLVDQGDPNASFNRAGLQNGVQWYKIGNVRGEYSNYSSAITNPNHKKLGHFVHYTSNSLQSVTHEVTGHACISSFNIPQLSSNEFNNLQSYMDPNSPVAITNYWLTLNNSDNGKDNKYPEAIKGSLNWIPTILVNITRETARMMSATMMWQKGGFVQSGQERIRLGRGIWEQMKDGNYIEYSDPEMLPLLCEQFMGDIFSQIGNIVPPDQRYFEFETGMGGLVEFRKYFQKYFQQNNQFLVMSRDIENMLTGTVRDLSYQPPQFTSVLIPEVGWIKPVHNPALDYRSDNQLENGMFGRFPRMSYSVIVKDVTKNTSVFRTTPNIQLQNLTNNGANMVMVRPRNLKDVRTTYQVGALAPDWLQTFTGGNGMSGTIDTFNGNTGFKVTQIFASDIFIKDASRCLVMEFKPWLYAGYR